MHHPTRRQAAVSLGAALLGVAAIPPRIEAGEFAVTLSDSAWRRRLSRPAYAVLRQEGTERPYSSPLNAEKRAGTFACAGCDQPLFSSRAKYDSGTGWPSFWDALQGATGTTEDRSLGVTRVATHCSRCGGHLGHVFDDGPRPTGKRWCINGVALSFRPDAA